MADDLPDALVKAIEYELGVYGPVFVDPLTLRRLQAERVTRAALAAMREGEGLNVRARITAALAKPLPDDPYCIHDEVFSPWDDVIEGIHGGYAAESDFLFIEALKAVRDKETFEFIDRQGFAGELALYVLSGHGMLEYGTSPRGGWPEPSIADLWQPLIDKWQAYAAFVWSDPLPAPPTPGGE